MNERIDERVAALVETAEPAAEPAPGWEQRAMAAMGAAHRKETRPVRRLAYALAFLLVLGLAAAGVFTGSRPPDGKGLLISVAQAISEARSIHAIAHGNVSDRTSPCDMSMDPYETESWESVDERRWARVDRHRGELSTFVIDLDRREERDYSSRDGILYVADLTPVMERATEVVRAMAEQGLRNEGTRMPWPLADAHESVQTEWRNGRKIATITCTGTNEDAAEAPGHELAERWVLEVDLATNHLLRRWRYVQAPGHEEQLLETTELVEYNVPVPNAIPDDAKAVKMTARAEELNEYRGLVLYGPDGKQMERHDIPE